MTHGQPREGFYRVHGYADRPTLEALRQLEVPNLSRAVTIALVQWAQAQAAKGSEPRPVDDPHRQESPANETGV